MSAQTDPPRPLDAKPPYFRSACGKCDRLGAVCGYCSRYCNRGLRSEGCICDCHAPSVAALPRRSNFDKKYRFLVTAGPRKGEVLAFPRDGHLIYETAKHEAEKLSRGPHD